MCSASEKQMEILQHPDLLSKWSAFDVATMRLLLSEHLHVDDVEQCCGEHVDKNDAIKQLHTLVLQNNHNKPALYLAIVNHTHERYSSLMDLINFLSVDVDDTLSPDPLAELTTNQLNLLLKQDEIKQKIQKALNQREAADWLNKNELCSMNNSDNQHEMIYFELYKRLLLTNKQEIYCKFFTFCRCEAEKWKECHDFMQKADEEENVAVTVDNVKISCCHEQELQSIKEQLNELRCAVVCVMSAVTEAMAQFTKQVDGTIQNSVFHFSQKSISSLEQTICELQENLNNLRQEVNKNSTDLDDVKYDVNCDEDDSLLGMPLFEPIMPSGSYKLIDWNEMCPDFDANNIWSNICSRDNDADLPFPYFLLPAHLGGWLITMSIGWSDGLCLFGEIAFHQRNKNSPKEIRVRFNIEVNVPGLRFPFVWYGFVSLEHNHPDDIPLLRFCPSANVGRYWDMPTVQLRVMD